MRASVPTNDIWVEFVETRRPELRDRLITDYAPLVRFVVGRLGIPPTSLLEAEDLVSYGMIGLINAIDRFDPDRGVRFEAFATSRIRGAVIDQLRTLNWLPRSAVSRMRQIEAALAQLEQQLGRPAREEEVANQLGVSLARYRQMLLEMSTTVLSLDAPLSAFMQDDEATALSDLLEDHNATGPDEQVERNELERSLSTAVAYLPEREQLLLSLYYHEELTMKEISKVVNVSESRVCQLHTQAIMRLRTALHAFHPQTLREADSQKVLSDRPTPISRPATSRNAGKQQAMINKATRPRRRVS
jgi:RNA polymerase sigma factor for flagellar operon FliA